MSGYEPEQHEEELRPSISRVKIIRNTKGDFWELSVALGTTESEMDALREIAVRQHQQLERDLSGPPL